MTDPNSDDYFNDSFTLDEDDLALLDETEAKFGSNVVQPPARFSLSPPPAKKFKGWLPPSGILPSIPEPDRTPPASPTSADEIPDAFVKGVKSYHVDRLERTDNDLGGLSADGHVAQPGPHLTTVRRTISNQNAAEDVVVTSARVLNPVQSINEFSTRPTISSRRTEVLQQTLQSAENSALLHATESQNAEMKKELASLKAQLEKVNREYLAAQEALKKAEVARYARDGEVSILRKTLEKASERHAADLEKLRETKEKADTQQARLQKEMKEQVERLRTEFVFKQHEWEASARKPTWSSRSKRTSSGPCPSPVPVPPDMQAWSSNLQPSQRSSLSQTPSRRKISSETGKSPKLSTRYRQVVPELKFPGFENSFAQSTPMKSPSRRRVESAIPRTPSRSPTKGKGKAPARSQQSNNILFSPVKMASQALNRSPRPVEDMFPADDTIQDFDMDMDVSTKRQRSSGKDPGQGSSPRHDVPDTSSIIGSEFLGDLEQEHMEVHENFEGIDWREELHFLLFTHRCRTSKTISFHHLLSASLESHYGYVEQYHRACSSVLETLGTKYKYNSLEDLMLSISSGLIRMGSILWRIRFLSHLTVLWDLMHSIMVYVPGFTSPALLSVIDFEGNPWTLLTIACEISRESLQLKEGTDDKEESVKAFLHSTLSLVETVAWTAPDMLSTNLALLPRTDRVLLTLLDQKQPVDLLSHAFRMLVVLATHLSLFRHFITLPDLDLFERPLQTPKNEPGRIPLIERLSSFLVDSSSLPRDIVDRDLVVILNFFALIKRANPEGRAALLKSTTLIPGLVYFLTNLSSLIWEEDEQVMRNTDDAKKTISLMRHGLDLLHGLVFPNDANPQDSEELTTDFDLRYKLHTPSHAIFNGLAHMFIVMIGRLSYADPPDWLSTELQNDIERMTEQARDLMDLIIEGPEGDSVWATYQGAETDVLTVNDDDEMEARMIEDVELIE